MVKAGVFRCLSYRVILQYVASNAILLYVYQAENIDKNKEELTHKKESNTNQQSIRTRDNQKVIKMNYVITFLNLEISSIA